MNLIEIFGANLSLGSISSLLEKERITGASPLHINKQALNQSLKKILGVN